MRALASGAVGLLISAVSLGVVAGPAVHLYSAPAVRGRLAPWAVGLLISAVSLGVVAGPAVHQYSVPPAGGSIQISSGSGVELVFPGPNANVIGRITVDGVVSQRK